MTGPFRMAQELLGDIWRGRWLAVWVAWGGSVVLGLTIFLMQDRYEASARVYIDTQSVLKPLMVGLAFQPQQKLRGRLGREVITGQLRPFQSFICAEIDESGKRHQIRILELIAEGICRQTQPQAGFASALQRPDGAGSSPVSQGSEAEQKDGAATLVQCLEGGSTTPEAGIGALASA